MKRLSALIGVFFLAACGQALAVGSMADVALYDRTAGRLLPVYGGDGRFYVAGRTGNEYEIRIHSNIGTDLLAVVSVDGVNVVTGETASTSQGGYVISAGQSFSIAGWRKSMSRVAAFYFTDHSSAYATRTGRPDDVGVIGVALFRRKAQAYLDQPESRPYPSAPGAARREAPEQLKRDADRASAAAGASQNAQGSAAAPAMENSLGTGHGRNQTSYVRYVAFERESDLPNEVVVVGYDTHANLIARGIIPAPIARNPNPFPSQFVPDPPSR